MFAVIFEKLKQRGLFIHREICSKFAERMQTVHTLSSLTLDCYVFFCFNFKNSFARI